MKLHRGLVIGFAVFLTMMLVAGLGFWAFSRSYFLVTVSGTSMTPTFQSGDHIIFSKVDEPRPDDYVVFKVPDEWKRTWLGDDDTSLIKRVRLLPGDVLSWDGASWARNGEVFSSITNGSCDQAPLDYMLREGEYFVTGDTTKTKTLDSREAFCLGLKYVVSEDEIEHFGRVKRVF